MAIGKGWAEGLIEGGTPIDGVLRKQEGGEAVRNIQPHVLNGGLHLLARELAALGAHMTQAMSDGWVFTHGKGAAGGSGHLFSLQQTR